MYLQDGLAKALWGSQARRMIRLENIFGFCFELFNLLSDLYLLMFSPACSDFSLSSCYPKQINILSEYVCYAGSSGFTQQTSTICPRNSDTRPKFCSCFLPESPDNYGVPKNPRLFSSFSSLLSSRLSAQHPSFSFGSFKILVSKF